MRYKSTRGGVDGLTFEDALLSGYASDGGLIVPDQIPKVELDTLQSWKTLSYSDVVKQIVSLFLTPKEIPTKDLYDLIDRAFSRFDIEEIVKLVSFGELHVMELWHGPTLAFKDLAMSCVGELYSYFLQKRSKNVIVIVGTSGDTGSSAIEAVKGKSNIDIIVILPHNRISKIQELMMTTVIEDNVHVFAADGFSDDFEVSMKELFADKELVVNHNLCSINSINWGRIMVQIAHHVYMYLQIAKKIGDPVDIIIPTGGCGNIASGMFAKAMGVPVNFVCVVNENDILHRTVSKGDFSLAPNVLQTLACSMDIQLPPNIERVFWLLSRDTEFVKTMMQEFDGKGKAEVSAEFLQKIRDNIRTAVVTDEIVVKTLKKCWNEEKYFVCPHTCAALAYYYGFSKYGTRESSGTRKNNILVPAVCVSTASVDKFPEAVEKAGLRAPEAPEKVKELFKKASRFCIMRKDEDWVDILKTKIRSITDKSRKLGKSQS